MLSLAKSRIESSNVLFLFFSHPVRLASVLYYRAFKGLLHSQQDSQRPIFKKSAFTFIVVKPKALLYKRRKIMINTLFKTPKDWKKITNPYIGLSKLKVRTSLPFLAMKKT